MPSQAAVRTFVLVGLGLLGLGSSSAYAQAFLNPPVVAWGPNRLDFFAVGENDGHLWHTSFNGVAWQTAWDDRGNPEPGRRAGSVSVVSWGPGRLDVFMGGGTLNDVWHTAWNGSSWQGWDDRGHPGSGAATMLAAVSWGPNRLDVFTVDIKSSHLWQLTWNGSTWVPWTDRGAPVGSGPLSQYVTAVSWAPNRIDLFGTTPQTFPKGGTVWHTAWNGASWQGWDTRGAPPNGTSGIPIAVSWGPGRLDVVAFSSRTSGSYEDECWHDSWNGSIWETAWDDRGAPPLGFWVDLAAVSWGPDRLDVFGLGPSSPQGNPHIWHNSWNGHAWQAAWDDCGTPTPNGPMGVWVTSWGYQRLDVFTIGQDGHLWQQTWNGSNWLPWADRGVPPENIAY